MEFLLYLYLIDCGVKAGGSVHAAWSLWLIGERKKMKRNSLLSMALKTGTFEEKEGEGT